MRIVRLRGSTVLLAVIVLFCSSAARGQPATGAVVVVTTPAGATVRVDGNTVGKSPVSVNNLMGGDHLVEVEWPDGKTVSSIARVTPGQSALLNVTPSGAAPQGGQPAPAPSQPAPGQPAPGEAAPGQPAPSTPAPLNQPIPEQTPDATGNAVTPGAVAVNVETPIRNPFHPQRRHLLGLSVAPGILCGTNACAFRGRIGFDFFIGDFHVSIIGGGFTTGGGGFGVELGSPYFQLGGPGSPFALAIRANIDVLALVATIGTTTTIDPITMLPSTMTNYGATGLFTNTYGPNFSVAIAHRLTLEARAGFGFGVFFPTIAVPFLVESWFGVRFQP